jgi:hypothetical protein
MGSKGKSEADHPYAGAAPATVIGEFPLHNTTGPWAGKVKWMTSTREPGDLPVAVVFHAGGMYRVDEREAPFA